jgi:hypothetical protein
MAWYQLYRVVAQALAMYKGIADERYSEEMTVKRGRIPTVTPSREEATPRPGLPFPKCQEWVRLGGVRPTLEDRIS